MRQLLKSPLLGHLFSMSVVQGLNAVLPLLTFPYLIRVLGLEQFGVFNYALATVHFLVVFVDYGLTLTGTRDVAVYKHDHQALNRLFSTKWALQFFLSLLALAVLAALVIWLPAWQAHPQLYFIAFLLVPANVLLPTWFFQGMQDFKTLAWLTFANKLLYVALVFTMIRETSQLELLMLLYAGCTLSASLVGWGYLRLKMKLHFQWPGWQAVVEALRSGWAVFISSFSVTLYSNSALLLLGFFADARSLGMFSVVEKVLLVFRLGLSTLFSVIFPKVSQLAAVDMHAMKLFLQRMQKWMLLGVLMAISVLLVTAPWLVQIITGAADPQTTALLRLSLPIPLLLALNLPAYQSLLAAHRQQWYARVMVTGALVGVSLNLFLAPNYFETGTAISILAAESIIVLGLLAGTEWRYPELRLWLKNQPKES